MDAKFAAKARALVRARKCAWIVAISMASMTMTFQVYHSVIFGRMPWPLAVLEGIGPLALSVLILEIAAVCEARWPRFAAYAIMGGSMYMSASATGAVVLHAMPGHMSWLFGVLLDAAALLAVWFILNGPRAEDAEREAAGLEASLRAEISAARQAHETDVRDLRAQLAEANEARTEAERLRADAEAQAAKLARKAEAKVRANGARKPRANGARKEAAPKVPNDVAARAEALKILDENPGISGAQLGLACNMSPRWGQLRKQEYGRHVTGAEGS